MCEMVRPQVAYDGGDLAPRQVFTRILAGIAYHDDEVRIGRRVQGRTPFFLETSLPGVFAAGDVRSGSVKRCASAVGEGAMAVMLVHRYLEKL